MGKRTTPRKKTGTSEPPQELFLLRVLMEHIPDAIYFKDIKSRFTWINRALSERFGLKDPAEAMGKTDFDFFTRDHAQPAFEDEQNIIRTGQPLLGREEKETWPDGHETWVSTTKMPLRDPKGRIVGTFGVSREITRRKQMEEALRNSEALYHSLVENLPQNILRKDTHGRFTFANQRFCATVGKPLTEVLGKTDHDFFPPELADKYRQDDVRVMASNEVFETIEENQPPGKEKVYVQVVKNALHDARGRVIGIQCLFWDVSERVRARVALQKSEERYALAVQGANDGLWDWDLVSNQIYYAPRWKSMLGLAEGEIGTNADEWMTRVHPDDLARLKAEMATHVLGYSPHFQHEHRMRHKDGSWRWMLSRGLAVRDESGRATRMAGSQTDITDRKRAEEELAVRAFYDPLTNLPNRTLFLERLGQALKRARRRKNYNFAVLFLDLDRFKGVNDSLGHMVGDQLLVGIARRLEKCVRPGDTVARLGGDEFTILLDEIRGNEDAVFVADRIQRELSTAFVLEGQDVFTTASIGIASGASYEKAEDILRDSDTAMYRAKEMGRARYEVFDTELHARAVIRLQMETDLRRALERKEFRVHYQPIVTMETRRVVSFEALVRWQHPQKGLIPPGDFLPLAEETGLIIPIDLWVLREACRQTKAWQEKYPYDPPLRVSVNLSSKQFLQQGLLEQVKDALRATGLEPASLTLEITESAIMEDIRQVTALVERLKDLKVQLYLDDFGTGYSSLSYLHRFPVDTLKIHHSFVGRLGLGGDQGELVKTITELARNLKMGVIAEGVETHQQLEQLRQLRCQQVQGFLFARPLDAEAAEAILRDGGFWKPNGP
jgi:diguanylate cyclase (GGDEF)-like protein/PAS domain S-box-containing protein